MPGDDVAAWLAAIAAGDPAAPALVASHAPPLRWGALAERIRATAAALAGVGLARGDVVAGVTADRVDMLAALALLPAGCTFAPLDPRLGEPAYAALLRRLDAKAVLRPADPEHPFARAARAADLVELGFVRVGDAPGMLGLVTLRRTAALERPRRWPARWCYVLATSGTTGAPKLVPQTHAQIVQSAVELSRWLDLGPRVASGHVSPGFLANGVRPSFHLALAGGAPVVALPQNDVDALIDAMEAGAIGYSAVSFTLCRELLARAADGRRVRPRGLRFVRVSAGKLRDDEILALEDLLGVPAITGLGSTESTIVLHQRLPPHPRTLGSLGREVAAEVRIADDDGRPLPSGAIGEIQVRSSRNFEGYVDDPAATSAALLDGWYRTGDLGRVGANGEYFHVGRVREAINRGGEKFSPAAIDDALRGLPGIADVACFAVPHPTLGEEVAAVVVPVPGADFDERAFLARARAVLDPRQLPKRVVAVQAIPRNAAGKVLRTELSRGHAAALGGGDARADGAGPLAAAIGGVWAATFGLDTVDADRSFASLGGTARESAAIAAALSDLLGIDVPAEALGSASTPAGLAESLGPRAAAAGPVDQ